MLVSSIEFECIEGSKFGKWPSNQILNGYIMIPNQTVPRIVIWGGKQPPPFIPTDCILKYEENKTSKYLNNVFIHCGVTPPRKISAKQIFLVLSLP